MPATEAFQDVIIVIPGILGSRLVRRQGAKEVTVWDFSIKSLPRLLREVISGRLVLEQHDAPPNDGIEAADLFSYQWFPGFFGVDDYRPLVESLRKVVSDSRQLLTFPYDWRASNRFAAQRLEIRALDSLKTWREASGCGDAKLWLVCHSMGGLVARYFCEHLGGAADTRAIVTFGTPHRGSVRALDALVNGKSVGPLDMTPLVQSLASAYELLPLFPVVRTASDGPLALHRVADFFALDPTTGADLATPGTTTSASVPLEPLAGLDRGRLQRALEFHHRIRGPAEARAARGADSPYRQYAFFNRRQTTPLSAMLQGRKLDVRDSYPYERNGVIREEIERGDGTVPSFASVPIEWHDSAAALALPDKHAAMQSSNLARDCIFNWLQPLDVRAKKGVSMDDAAVVELNVPETVAVGSELVVQAAALRPMNLMIEVQHVESGLTQTRPLSCAGDDVRRETGFARLAPGVHRVKAIPADRLLPTVSDYVLVDS